MNSQPYFSDPKLQTAFQAIELDIKERIEILNELSKDIKSIEQNLTQSACPEGISLQCDATQDYLVNKNFSFCDLDEINNQIYCGQMVEHFWFLSWGKSHNGTNRLLQKISKRTFDVYVRPGGHPAFDVWRELSSEGCEQRPLIECSVHDRQRAKDHLPEFLLRFGRYLRNPDKMTLDDFGFDDFEKSWKDSWKEAALIWHPY